MEANSFTLENIAPLLLALDADSKQGGKLASMLFKLPRYRSRHKPFESSFRAPNNEARFTLDWIKKTDGSLYLRQYPWGSYPKRADTKEKVWDYVRNHGYKPKIYGVPTDNGSEFLHTIVKWHSPIDAHYAGTQDYSSIYFRNGYGMVGITPYSVIDDGIVTTSDNADVPSADYDISSWGPTAWRKYKPAKPTISLANFIGESRELPKLLHAELKGIRTIADFNLAVEFGWKPLLRDILDMLKFVEKFQKQINFLINNAGKPIHRSGPVVTSQTSTVIYNNAGASSSGISTIVNGRFYPADYTTRRTTVTRHFEQSINFSGSFVFWFDGGSIDVPKLTARLAGLEVTPQVVWNLLPWSWLFDWFSNLGDQIDNLVTEVADQQVATYAYITSKTRRRYEWTGTDGYIKCGISRSFDSTCRRQCHPFGLGSGTNLTLRQAGILAALSISRSPAKIP